MFLKRSIPESALSLVGPGAEFGDLGCFQEEIVPSWNILEQAPQCKTVNDGGSQCAAVLHGNRCGHIRRHPRYYQRPLLHKPRPSILEEAIERLKSVYRFPKKYLKKLFSLNENNRQKRSERREATVSVLQVLMHYLELSTLRVGFYSTDGRFASLDLEYIARKAGIGVLRARRAITDLVKAGYIKVSRQYTQKEDGGFAGLPSIREISIRFFIDLGIDIKRLLFTRDWKRKKQEKAEAKQNGRKLKDIVNVVKALGSKAFKPLVKRVQKPDDVKSIEKKKALIAKAMAMNVANPERPISDYLKELQRRLE